MYKEDSDKLIVEYKNKNPMELIDLATSMSSISREFSKRFHAESYGAKLYVREVRNGSTIIELVPVVIGQLPILIEHYKTIITFVEQTIIVVNWLLGKEDKPEHITREGLNNITNIVEPIAKDVGSQINIGSYNDNSRINNITINYTESNAIQNRATKELEILKEPIVGLHEKVLLHWVQAKNDIKSNAGDKAKIESITNKSVKAIFDKKDLKQTMLYDEPHPFSKAYLVDVKVETINNNPTVYKIIKLHEIIDVED